MKEGVGHHFEELIGETRAQAKADESFLGSDAHLLLLEGWVVVAAPHAHLVWLEVGDRSYWQARTKELGLERPHKTGLADDDSAEYAALDALHEVLHARYSDDVGDHFRARVGALNPQLQKTVVWLYNHIEDARVARLGKAADPNLGSHLDKLCDEALRQEAPQGRSLREQFLAALLHRLCDASEGTWSEPVVKALERCEPILDGVFHGVTATSGEAALLIVRIWLEDDLNEQ